MSAIDPDPGRCLDDARRRAGQLVLLRRAAVAIAVAVAVVIVAVASPSILDLTRGQAPQPAAPPSFAAIAPSILGTWRVQYTCREFVSAFEDAGIPTFAAEKAVELGLQPGPADELARRARFCVGARNIERTVTFSPDGYLRRYQDGRVVDDCRCYRLIGERLFVSPGDFRAPDITLRYQLSTDTVRFEAVKPDPCSSPVCRQALATAVGQYAVGTWHRFN
jgi:hypothetical protein